jgi:cytidylate kinase
VSEEILIVAIDGPSGVGKSTAAKALARRLGVSYLDTGAMYRALALALVDRGVDVGDPDTVARLADEVPVSLAPRPDGIAAVLLDGASVEDRIRNPEVGQASSQVSAVPSVRRRLVALQREFAGRHGGVVEGRDIGTRVFPDTPHKFFLDARPDVRHRRRHEELVARGREVSLDQVAREMDSRDARDRSREDSPLVCDERYQAIDTSDLTSDEVAEAMVAAIRVRTGPTTPGG